MNSHEHPPSHTLTGDHRVQLFDEPETRAESVARFLYDGWRGGSPLLVVAAPAHWTLMAARLEALGCPVAATIASGRLAVLDAETTLATFTRNGWIDAARFEVHVADVVARMAAGGHRLHVYGEMVDILASHGNLEAAEHLEALWNDLGARHAFTLQCGYSAAHFGDPRAAAALHHICLAHTRIELNPHDVLASWLLRHTDGATA